jgi:hypothetical protein
VKIDAVSLLQSYTNASLQQMARHRGLEIKGKNKEALVGLLAPSLYDTGAVSRALDDLASSERFLLDDLIVRGGEASTISVRAELEKAGQVVPDKKNTQPWSYNREKGSPWERDSRKFADIVARLGVLGLVFSSGSTNASGGMVELGTPAQRLFIPDDVLAHLPRVTLEPETIDVPPRVATSDPAALLRDLYALLSFADQSPIPLTTRDQITKKALVRIDESFQRPEGAALVRSEDELGRLPLLRVLAEECALLVPRASALIPGERVESFLRQPAGERRQQLYRAWLQTPRLGELFRIKNLSISTRGGIDRQAATPVVAARQRVVKEITELPAEQWISLSHLVERMRRRAYEFLLPRSYQVGSYYYGYSASHRLNPYDGSSPLRWVFQNIYDEGKGWSLVEAAFIRQIVAEALHWLGIVDLGFADQADDRPPVAFRITADGARLLRGDPLVSQTPASNVVVQPNFHIFAFEPTGEDVLFHLDRVAERVRAERVVEYRLTRESVYRAQRAGTETSAIAAFLERVSNAPLPQNVLRTLADWGAQHERIVVRRGVPLVHALDEATLDALYARPEFAQLLGRRAAPTAALVSLDNLTKLYQNLLERGQLPALTEGAGESSIGQPDDIETDFQFFSVDDAERITFRQRLPSIYVHRALSAFADDIAQDTAHGGVMKMSAASLRRAARTGWDADKIISILERWHAGPLPETVPAAIRRWAKDWGRGALVETVLLQVESADILADLFADPELKPYLQKLPDAPTIAIVRSDGLTRVRAALSDRGMDLADQLIK